MLPSTNSHLQSIVNFRNTSHHYCDMLKNDKHVGQWRWRAKSKLRCGYTFQNPTQTTLSATFEVQTTKLAKATHLIWEKQTSVSKTHRKEQTLEHPPLTDKKMNTRMMMMMMKKLLVRHFLQVLNLMSIHLTDKLLSEKWVFNFYPDCTWVFLISLLFTVNKHVMWASTSKTLVCNHNH